MKNETYTTQNEGEPMKLNIIEKITVALIAMILVIIAYRMITGWVPPACPTVIQVKVPPEFIASGFQKSNYVVGTYRGLPAVYDVMQDQISVVAPSMPEANPKGE